MMYIMMYIPDKGDVVLQRRRRVVRMWVNRLDAKVLVLLGTDVSGSVIVDFAIPFLGEIVLTDPHTNEL